MFTLIANSTPATAPSAEENGEPAHAQSRVELDRKSGEVSVYVPELDDEGTVIGEAVDQPSDFGRIAAFAAKQVINQRLRDIGDDKILGQFRGKRLGHEIARRPRGEPRGPGHAQKRRRLEQRALDVGRRER